MIGVGYRAEMKGKLLELNLGFSHPIVLRAPDEIKLKSFPRKVKLLLPEPTNNWSVRQRLKFVHSGRRNHIRVRASDTSARRSVVRQEKRPVSKDCSQ